MVDENALVQQRTEREYDEVVYGLTGAVYLGPWEARWGADLGFPVALAGGQTREGRTGGARRR